MSTAGWKYIGFHNCDKKRIQSPLNNAANYVRLYVTTAYLGLSLPCCNETAHPLQRCRAGLHSPVIFQVLVAINPLPVYGLALEHAWNTIGRAKRRKSDALRFKFQTSSAGAVPRTSPFSSWTQYCEPEMLNYGVTLASFFYAIK